MLSFEISAIDIVLLIAVLVLLLLFITQKKGQAVAESRLPVPDREESLEKSEIRDHGAKKKLFLKESSSGFQECVHHFGYLRNLPQNTPVPDECFGCPKVMQCLFLNEKDLMVR